MGCYINYYYYVSFSGVTLFCVSKIVVQSNPISSPSPLTQTPLNPLPNTSPDLLLLFHHDLYGGAIPHLIALRSGRRRQTGVRADGLGTCSNMNRETETETERQLTERQRDRGTADREIDYKTKYSSFLECASIPSALVCVAAPHLCKRACSICQKRWRPTSRP
eukprot:sb/3472590/